VPLVYGHDAEFDNDVGMPYILMEAMPRKKLSGGLEPQKRHLNSTSIFSIGHLGKDNVRKLARMVDGMGIDSGSMRSMFGRKTNSPTVTPAGQKSHGAPRTHPQRSVWTNPPNHLQRNELTRRLHRRLHQNDSNLPSEEIIGGVLEKFKQERTQNRRWRGVRKMDGSSSQRLRNHPRNDSILQPRPERCCR
jgi:hypothetical protein